MPNHVMREGLWTSRKLARCSDGAAAWYPWIYLVCDEWGRFEWDPRAIWMCVFRKRPSVKQSDVENWLLEYAREGLLIRYHIGGELAFWTNFRGRKAAERKASDYPDPLQFQEVVEELERIKSDFPASKTGGSSSAVLRRGRRKTAPEQNLQSIDQIRSELDRIPSESEAEAAPPPAVVAVELYNATFGTRIGNTPGNVKAVNRALGEGYTLETFRTVFEAVRDGTTQTAAWCAENNREFEYLIRPAYRKHGTGELIQGPLDKIPNEIATGRKAG